MTRLMSIPEAVQALAERGKPIKRWRLYELVRTGEIEAIEIGGRLHVTDLDAQLKAKAQAQTAQRKQKHAPRPQLVVSAPRRFGHGDPKVRVQA